MTTTTQTTQKPFNRRTLQQALDRIGLKAEITGAGKRLGVELVDSEDFDVFQDQVAAWGGFSCMHGGWVLRQNYKTLGPDVDFCHPASHHHW